NCIFKPEVIFKLEQGKEPWCLEEKSSEQSHQDYGDDDLIKKNKKSKDRHLEQIIFSNNKLLSREEEKVLGKPLNLCIAPVPSTKISCKYDSVGVNMQNISEFITNNGRCSTEKSDCCNVCKNLPPKIKFVKTHTVEKFYECNKNGSVFSYKESLPEHQKCQLLEQTSEYSEIIKAFYDETACVTHKNTHTGEKSCKNNEFRENCDETTLSDHQRTETGDKDSHLNQCGKSVKEHNKFNISVKHYDCNANGNNISRNSYLIQSHRIVTEENPLVCNDRTQMGDKFRGYNENTKSCQIPVH
ncbi:Zinc finger protein 510, partial [Galemys pyrenaicus]